MRRSHGKEVPQNLRQRSRKECDDRLCYPEAASPLAMRVHRLQCPRRSSSTFSQSPAHRRLQRPVFLLGPLQLSQAASVIRHPVVDLFRHRRFSIRSQVVRRSCLVCAQAKGNRLLVEVQTSFVMRLIAQTFS